MGASPAAPPTVGPGRAPGHPVPPLHGIPRLAGGQHPAPDRVRGRRVRRRRRLGLAFGGPPEEAVSALATYDAIGSLGVGALCTAHVNRNGDTDRPFGSTYWSKAPAHLVRQAPGGWCRGCHARGVLPEGERLCDPGAAGVRVHLHRRSDVRPPLRPGGRSGARLRAAGVDRILHALRGGMLTIVEIANETGAEPDTISRTLRRMRSKDRVRDIEGTDRGSCAGASRRSARHERGQVSGGVRTHLRTADTDTGVIPLSVRMSGRLRGEPRREGVRPHIRAYRMPGTARIAR